MAWLTEAEYRYWHDIYTGKYANMERPEWLSRPTVIRAVQKPKPVRQHNPFGSLTFEMPDLTAGITADFRRLATEPQRQVQQAAERLARIGRFQLGVRPRPAKRSGRRVGAASR